MHHHQQQQGQQQGYQQQQGCQQQQNELVHLQLNPEMMQQLLHSVQQMKHDAQWLPLVHLLGFIQIPGAPGPPPAAAASSQMPQVYMAQQFLQATGETCAPLLQLLCKNAPLPASLQLQQILRCMEWVISRIFIWCLWPLLGRVRTMHCRVWAVSIAEASSGTGILLVRSSAVAVMQAMYAAIRMPAWCSQCLGAPYRPLHKYLNLTIPSPMLGAQHYTGKSLPCLVQTHPQLHRKVE